MLAGLGFVVVGVRSAVYSIYERRLRRQLAGKPIPHHVAVMLDGNRRWARAAGFEDVTEGHVAGARRISDLLEWCTEAGVQHVTIWLLSTQNAGTDREKDIIAGTSAGSRTVWVMKTTDEGVTWSAPVEITSSVKGPGWTWYATGPGVGIHTTSGRLVIPANHAEANGVHRSHLMLSDDGGQTWKLGASADAGTNESQVVELHNGTLMLNMRNHPPRPENFRMVATSEDGGRTLSKATADPALVEPPAQASVLRLSTSKTHDRNRLLFSNPASARRERMTVRLSYDEAATWPVSRIVHEGPAAYSSLVVLPDNSLGVLFERGASSPYERITFARFTLDWLTDGKDRLSSIKHR